MSKFHSFTVAAPLLCCLTLGSPSTGAQQPLSTVSKPASAPDPEQQLIDKDKALKRKIRIWEWTLTQIAKRENATMFVDVPLDLDPPNIAYDRPYGVEAMTALANSSDRDWKQTVGIQTFTRSITRKSTAQVTAALNWLAVLPEVEFDHLFAGNVAISDLDPPTQDLMLGLAGWEPDMTFALLGKSDITQVQLIISPKFRYSDPKTGTAKEITITCNSKPTPLPSKSTSNSLPKLKSLDMPTGGALKFGNGVILTLAELAKRAGEAFHLTYTVDARIGENRYFVSGSYLKEDFETVLGRITTVPPVRAKEVRPDRAGELSLLRSRIMERNPGNLDVSRLRGGIPFKDLARLNEKYGTSEDLKTSDFLQGKSMTASDLCQGKPGLTLYMQQLGIGPSTMLTLDAGFGLSFAAPGDHMASRDSATVEGEVVPIWAHNQISIGLQ